MHILKQFERKINGTLETLFCLRTMTYLNYGQTDHGELAHRCFEQFPDRTGLICAFSAAELCKTMTVKPNRSSKNLIIYEKTDKNYGKQKTFLC